MHPDLEALDEPQPHEPLPPILSDTVIERDSRMSVPPPVQRQMSIAVQMGVTDEEQEAAAASEFVRHSLSKFR